MLQRLLGIYLIIHVIVCVLLYLGVRFHILRFSGQLLPLIALVPGAGIVVAVAAEYNSRCHKTGKRRIDLEELHLGEEDLRFSTLDSEGTEEVVIPLEEAMSVNDAETRRKLMLDILHENPNAYVELLQEARLDDDIEVTHYASTAIMELQREHELALQKAETEYRADPENYENVNKYLHSLERYIKSGLIDENIRFVYRARYGEVLKQKIALEPENMDAMLQAVDNYMDMGNITEASAMVESMIIRWPNREEAWLAKLKVCRNAYDQAGIQSVIREVKKRNIYLTPQGRSILSFWEEDEGKEEQAHV